MPEALTARIQTTVKKKEEKIYLSGPAEGADVKMTLRPVLTAYH